MPSQYQQQNDQTTLNNPFSMEQPLISQSDNQQYMDDSSDESLESNYLEQPYKIKSEGQMMTFKS